MDIDLGAILAVMLGLLGALAEWMRRRDRSKTGANILTCLSGLVETQRRVGSLESEVMAQRMARIANSPMLSPEDRQEAARMANARTQRLCPGCKGKGHFEGAHCHSCNGIGTI